MDWMDQMEMTGLLDLLDLVAWMLQFASVKAKYFQMILRTVREPAKCNVVDTRWWQAGIHISTLQHIQNDSCSAVSLAWLSWSWRWIASYSIAWYSHDFCCWEMEEASSSDLDIFLILRVTFQLGSTTKFWCNAKLVVMFDKWKPAIHACSDQLLTWTYYEVQ